MSKCANCGATLSCGCQKRTLANGKQGCSKCVSPAGNNKIEPVRVVKNNQYDNPAPIIKSVEITNKNK